MPQHKLTIHYKGYIITRENLGKYKWRIDEFETEKEALDAIDEHILFHSYYASQKKCTDKILKQQTIMQITEIYYQRNFQVGEFLYEHYGVKIGINGSEDIDQAFTEAERIVKQQHYLKNKDNTFYANVQPTELPIVQVEEKKYAYPVATDDDVVKEIQSYKLGVNAFIAVYSEMVNGNPKLEEAYNKKLAELTK